MSNWKDVRNHMETGEPIEKILEGMEMIPVVGVSFVEGYPANIHKLANLFRHRDADLRIDLVRNPENPYDKNAIEVHYRDSMLGHIPKEIAARLAPEIDAGHEYLATVYQVRISPENPNNPGLDILLDERLY